MRRGSIYQVNLQLRPDDDPLSQCCRIWMVIYEGTSSYMSGDVVSSRIWSSGLCDCTLNKNIRGRRIAQLITQAHEQI